ncbi:hypothetical protein N9L78_02395 [Gammaproteobacteria bacterium]|nr:hypothetical protein [Gammaproteobacteria bacterium]
MSFIKKYQLKDKFFLFRDFFQEFVITKRTYYFIGASLILSILIIQFSKPEFYVSSTLREAENLSQQKFSTNSIASEIILGAGKQDSTIFGAFRANMYSYALAQRMWEQGWGSKVFGDGNMDPEYFNKISKNYKISDRIESFLLGYDLSRFYSAHDLQSYIAGRFEITRTKGLENIVIFTMTPNKEFAIQFMNALILETDRYAKNRLIKKSNEIISASYAQLATAKNTSITSAISSTINAEYFKIANLENDMPYHLYVIDPPYSSEYPISPDTTAIIFSNIIIFLFLSIFFSFVKKNREDLW